jgi:hypothetical protein
MKKLILLSLCLSLYFGVQANTLVSIFSGGSGTSGDPYLIGNLADLQYLQANSSYWASGKYYKQTADIDISSISNWTPIGNRTTYFEGIYDGNSHTILGLKINDSQSSYVGLFGLCSGATIQNLGVINADVKADSQAAVLCGNSSGSTINACYVSGNISGGQYLGGIIGYSNSTVTTNSVSLCKITGYFNCGGITGILFAGSITNSYSSGNIVCAYSEVGGIAGTVYNNGNIVNAFSTCAVSGTSWGGIAGKIYAGTVSYSYTTLSTVVGIGGTATNSGTNTNVSFFKTQSNFTNSSNYDTSKPWDFTNTWAIDTNGVINNGYPYLKAFATVAYPTPTPTSTITFDSNGGSAIAPITQDEGTAVTTPANPTKTGYTFQGWLPAVPSTMPVDDMTCVAQWQAIPNPTVTAISPTSGNTAGGTSITITGTNFTGATAVKFGTTAATNVLVVTATRITATSPAGSGIVDVTVITPGGTSVTSASTKFTYNLTNISVSSTAGGLSTAITAAGGDLSTVTNLTITGTIDATDFKAMRDNMPLLAVLDMSAATIAAYTGSAGTGYGSSSITYPANEVPQFAFCNSSTWVGKTSLTSVLMPTTATSIGTYAFSYCSGLTAITIPTLVASIGNYAFQNCSGLTAITISASVTSIGFNAFGNSKISVSVDVNNPNYSSTDGVLFNKNQTTIIYIPSTKTASYTIPSSVTSIDYNAFSGCSGLTSITIPSSVASIGSFTFQNCSGLTTITIPSLVTSIGSYAFVNCSALTSITIPASVTSIGNNAFSNCTSLTAITIPSSVTSIGSYAFSGCTKLATVNTYASTPVSLAASTTVFVSVPTTTCVLHVPVGSKGLYQGAAQWQDFTNITEDLVIATLTTQAVSNIGTSTATGNANITGLGVDNPTQYGVVWSTATSPKVVLATKTTQGAIAVTGAFTSDIIGLTANTLYYVRPYLTNSTGTYYGTEVSFTTLAVPTITSISPTSGSTTGGTSVTINGTNFTGASAVKFGTNTATNVIIVTATQITATSPAGSGIVDVMVTTPGGTSATSASTKFTYNLTNISVSSTAGGLSTAITAAGGDLSTVTNLTISGIIDATDFKAMRDNMPLLAVLDMSAVSITAYTGSAGTVSGSSSRTYPANEMPQYAFYNSSTGFGKTSLTSVLMPTTVTSIGYQAFSKCSSLTALTISTSVSSIGTNAFGKSKISVSVDANNPNYSSIDGVLFNKNQTTIIYTPNTKTGSYTIPASVTSIGYTAFSDCNSLNAITIPTSVTSIGGYGFNGCSGLTTITIPASVTSIENAAFVNCSGLSTITIPALVTSIGSGAFQGCSGLTTITIPSSVSSIGSYAFYSCTKLATVNTYNATPVSLAASTTVFGSVPTTTCVLHVPVGSIGLYQGAAQWQNFTNITEDLVIATLTTQAVSNIGLTTATGNANITGLGVDNPTQYGVVWSTVTSPTVALATKTTQGAIAVTGAFTSDIIGLSANTLYYVRPYLTNSTGTYYGAEVSFTTLTPSYAPTDITLSASAIDENVEANSTVGTLSSTDPDAGNTFTYTLVVGTGSTDNASFSINGSSLRITNSPDFETKNSYSVRVRTADQGGLYYEKAFTITINNVNEAPTNIVLSASAIDENVVANSTVGTLSSTDTDAANTFTYTLVAGIGSADNASFNISGSSLRITNSPDFETKNSYSVRVRTTDQGSLFYEKAFTITINNVNDAPIVTSNDATFITTIAATLNGSVNANNASTAVTFDYGLTTSYGTNVTATPSTVTGTSATAVSYDLSGLTPNTTYHFRVNGVNAGGTTNGNDLTFTTLALPTITAISPASGSLDGGTTVTITGTNLTGATAVMFGTTAATNYNVVSDTEITATSPAGAAGAVDVTVTAAGITSATNASTKFTYCLTNIAVSSIGGGLYSAIIVAGGDLSTVTNLTITGTINAIDFKTMRDNMPLLAVVDMSAVTIASVTGNGTIGISTYPADAIPLMAFYNNSTGIGKTSLTSVILPTTCTSIANGAFVNCSGLLSVTIPSMVTSIGTNAFFGCSGLTALTISASVSSYGFSTFNFCTGLSSINSYSPVPAILDIDASVFGSVATDICVLHVPVGTKGLYQAATLWGDFVNIVDDLLIPTFANVAVSNLGFSSATITGDNTGLGINNPTQSGVVWSTTPAPTVALSTKTTKGALATTGTFTSDITSLSENTAYYARAYATNSTGTFYSDEVVFSTLGVPTISSFTPEIGGNGTTITITGTSLTGATAVTVGGIAAGSVTVLNATTVTAIVSTGATGTITITTPGGTATSAAGFNWIEGPTITSFSPLSGGAGTEITIYGTNLTGATAIQLADISVSSYKVLSPFTATAVVGIGTTGKIKVTGAGGTATSDVTFTYLATVNVPVAGGLSAALTATLATVTDLTITGTIDARDFKTMRDKMPMLARLDIGGATIAAYNGTEGPSSSNTVNYPENQLPDYAFCSNTTGIGKASLKSIVMPTSINSIGTFAFRSSGLTGSLTIPANVTSIGNNAFSSCIGLTGALTLPNTLITLGNSAFSSCTGLTGALTLSNSLTSIGSSAFASCSGLTGSVIIPNSVKSIGASAFLSCSKLSSITVPTSVTFIGTTAFKSCTGLTSFYAYSAIPIVLSPSTKVFESMPFTCVLHIPVGSLSLYQVAPQWNGFFNPMIILTDLIAPTVTTQAVSSISITTATANGFISSLGVPNQTTYGICWNTSGTPTILDSKVDKGAATATGAFTAGMTNLIANTSYYVRAFATNNMGTSYGTEETFKTAKDPISGLDENGILHISVYPNPVDNAFRIIGLSGVSSISLTDLSGKVMLLKQVSDSEAVSISTLPKGVYILKVKNNDVTTEQKIVKK